MAQKPTERPQRSEAQPQGAPPSPSDDRDTERLGPVAIERMNKDDGRALIVYRVVEPGPR